MNTPTTCNQCGTPLKEPTADGLCPKCLLSLGVATRIMTQAGPAGVLRTWDGALPEAFEFGPYKVLRLLGQGGMGTVYEAEDTRSGRIVALKVLGKFFDSAEMRQRFMREGQLAAGVRHPNVVAVLAAEEIDDTAVIAMEIVPGGTLRDRVKNRGPLSPAEAVEATLQIIDGLEEAHAHGVLHRDVKPANCFVTGNSTVKVGDFGLSISTLARPDAHLTRTGAIMGTPAFASPEQLRGTAIDARSDIYAVGATLYFLLTGRPTHDAESLPALIAAVLEQMPPEPRSIRPVVPRGLSRVVMRCLAKRPEARFSSYAELRRALLPYATPTSAPATLGLRFVAGIIDGGLSMLPAFMWMTFTGDYALDGFLIERSWNGFTLALSSMVWMVLYGTVFEGIWGTSPGKALCGLQVIRPGSGLVPGIPRAAIRALIFSAFPEIVRQSLVLAKSTAVEYQQDSASAIVHVADWISFGLIAGLFLSMRRRNAFAAVHDILSGTRVVARASMDARPRLATAEAIPPKIGRERIGPYAVVAREGDWVFGWDEILRRPVWIRRQPAGTPAVTPERRDLNRPARLRWLNGLRSADQNWDAFEAPSGGPLTTRLDRGRPWADVRFWAHDLADELSAARADGTLPSRIGLDHVWLTSSGRAVLAEYPVPGALPTVEFNASSDREIQNLLRELITSASRPPLPLHAWEFLQALREARFEAAGVVAGNLRSLLTKPARVTASRRLLGLGLLAISSFLASLVGTAVNLHLNRSFDDMWAAEQVGRRSPRIALDLHASGLLSKPALDSLAVHLGGHYGDVFNRPEFWERPETLGLTFKSTRDFAKDAAAQFAAVEPGQLKTADAAMEALLQEAEHHDRRAAVWMPPLFFVTVFGVLQLFAIIPAPWLKAPLGLRWLGMAVVRKDGTAASKLRVAVRSVASLLPAACGIVGAAAIFWAPDEPGIRGIFLVSAILFFVCGLWSILRPARGPADVLAGTALVMR